MIPAERLRGAGRVLRAVRLGETIEAHERLLQPPLLIEMPARGDEADRTGVEFSEIRIGRTRREDARAIEPLAAIAFEAEAGDRFLDHPDVVGDRAAVDRRQHQRGRRPVEREAHALATERPGGFGTGGPFHIGVGDLVEERVRSPQVEVELRGEIPFLQELSFQPDARTAIGPAGVGLIAITKRIVIELLPADEPKLLERVGGSALEQHGFVPKRIIGGRFRGRSGHRER